MNCTLRWIRAVLGKTLVRKRSQSRGDQDERCSRLRMRPGAGDLLDESVWKREKSCGGARATALSHLRVAPLLFKNKDETEV